MKTDRQQVVTFARINRITVKPMCGGVLAHRAHGSDWRNDFSKTFDSWAEAKAYFAAQIEAVQSGAIRSYPWDAAQ